MDVTMDDFNDLLTRLEEARFADEDVHQRNGSLTERTASRDALLELRAEMARMRADIGRASMGTPRMHDPRTK